MTHAGDEKNPLGQNRSINILGNLSLALFGQFRKVYSSCTVSSPQAEFGEEAGPDQEELVSPHSWRKRKSGHKQKSFGNLISLRARLLISAKVGEPMSPPCLLCAVTKEKSYLPTSTSPGSDDWVRNTVAKATGAPNGAKDSFTTSFPSGRAGPTSPTFYPGSGPADRGAAPRPLYASRGSRATGAVSPEASLEIRNPGSTHRTCGLRTRVSSRIPR